jgi:hypothetical protein
LTTTFSLYRKIISIFYLSLSFRIFLLFLSLLHQHGGTTAAADRTIYFSGATAADRTFYFSGGTAGRTGLHPSASTFFPSTRLTTIPPSIRRETSYPLSFFSFFLVLVAGATTVADAAVAVAVPAVVVNVEVDDDSIIV